MNDELKNPIAKGIFLEQSSISFDQVLSQNMEEESEDDDFSFFVPKDSSLSLLTSSSEQEEEEEKGKEEKKGMSLSLSKKNKKNNKTPLFFNKKKVNQVDELIQIRQLFDNSSSGKIKGQLEMEMVEDLNKATGFEEENKEKTLSQKLERLVQLTGFSDPVYCEAFVNVHQYDILLEVTVINQTSDTLQNLTLELSTIGDLKLVERPNPITLLAQEQKMFKANIKVSSTETGFFIFFLFTFCFIL